MVGRVWPALAVVAAIALAAFKLAVPEKRPVAPPAAKRGARKMIAPSPSERCPEGSRRRLVVMRGEDVLQQLTADEAILRMGGAKIAGGRHEGERALPLASVLADREPVREVEVIPCSGEPLRFTARDLQLDAGRFMLVRSKRGSLKLIDRDSDKGSALVKNVAVVRLVP